jgi:hypothetical protein
MSPASEGALADVARGQHAPGFAVGSDSTALRLPKVPGLRGGLITGFGYGESIGSSSVKGRGSPSGEGTESRFGRLGSGNFGPPSRGGFTISRFVMNLSTLCTFLRFQLNACVVAKAPQ